MKVLKLLLTIAAACVAAYVVSAVVIWLIAAILMYLAMSQYG